MAENDETRQLGTLQQMLALQVQVCMRGRCLTLYFIDKATIVLFGPTLSMPTGMRDTREADTPANAAVSFELSLALLCSR